MESSWITVQQKTFTKWLNSKIKARDVAVNDLVKDLSDGVLLIHLLEILGNESLGRYASQPKLRVQRFENVNKALNFIRSRGIQMTNIGAEDVVDGNRKIILGLIWTLILRFTISDINEEGMTAKEGLLLWCQRKTACYDEVEVRDFSTSWNDGLAFCALLDIHRPDLIDYESLDKSDHRGNMQLAFNIASKEIGIPDLLDVEDVCDVAKPDERSLMTYIAYWFHAFSQMERVENAGRRVEKFVQNMQGAWEMQNSFERRMQALLDRIVVQRRLWTDATFEGTYLDAKNQAVEFARYKKTEKREWVAEKSDLAGLLGNIKTKLSTYRLKPYEPPPELSLERLDHEWSVLMKEERDRSQLINETIRDIKDGLRRTFADKANDFTLTLNTLSLAISGLEGDVEEQLRLVQRLSESLPPLEAFLETIEAIDRRCTEANIEENDYTTYTYDELWYEFGLVQSSVSKKLSFLENQMVARNMTNLTPIQLEEFESVFRHFDRHLRNALNEIEFSAALASLGLVYDEDEMHAVFEATSGRRDVVTFEQFIKFMVEVTEDQNTAEQVFQSFREVADGKPYVTELDLRHSLVPDEVIDQLKQSLPVLPLTPPRSPQTVSSPARTANDSMSNNPPPTTNKPSIPVPTDSTPPQESEPEKETPKYDYVAFMDTFTGGSASASACASRNNSVGTGSSLFGPGFGFGGGFGGGSSPSGPGPVTIDNSSTRNNSIASSYATNISSSYSNNNTMNSYSNNSNTTTTMNNYSNNNNNSGTPGFGHFNSGTTGFGHLNSGGTGTSGRNNSFASGLGLGGLGLGALGSMSPPPPPPPPLSRTPPPPRTPPTTTTTNMTMTGAGGAAAGGYLNSVNSMNGSR